MNSLITLWEKAKGVISIKKCSGKNKWKARRHRIDRTISWLKISAWINTATGGLFRAAVKKFTLLWGSPTSETDRYYEKIVIGMNLILLQWLLLFHISISINIFLLRYLNFVLFRVKISILGTDRNFEK